MGRGFEGEGNGNEGKETERGAEEEGRKEGEEPVLPTKKSFPRPCANVQYLGAAVSAGAPGAAELRHGRKAIDRPHGFVARCVSIVES